MKGSGKGKHAGGHSLLLNGGNDVRKPADLHQAHVLVGIEFPFLQYGSQGQVGERAKAGDGDGFAFQIGRPRETRMAHDLHQMALDGVGQENEVRTAHRRLQRDDARGGREIELSGGMQQRVMIAMALSCRPSVILADEPTTALDVTVQAQVLEVLRSAVIETGTALLLISHDLGVVAGITQRVCVMYAGQIVEEAPTTALFSSPRSPYTQSLLKAVPRIDQPVTGRRLAVIDGHPPSNADETTGCRFSPRCPERRDICSESSPNLVSLEPSHKARCFGSEPGGWIGEKGDEELATRSLRSLPRGGNG